MWLVAIEEVLSDSNCGMKCPLIIPSNYCYVVLLCYSTGIEKALFK